MYAQVPANEKKMLIRVECQKGGCETLQNKIRIEGLHIYVDNNI